MTTLARSRPTVLIADDHPGIRAALVRLVGTECDVVGAVADGHALVRETRRLRPNVIVSDVIMPGLDGFAAGRQIKAEWPQVRLIFVTAHEDPEFAAEALHIGAAALLRKVSVATQLLDVIRREMAGESIVGERDGADDLDSTEGGLLG